MNKDTYGQESVAIPASVSAPSAQSPALADLFRQRLEIDSLIETLIKAQEDVLKKDQGLRQEVVKMLPGLLGVGKMSEALEYLAGFTGWQPKSTMEQKKALAIAMRVKGSKAEDIAKEIGVSTASCWTWFRKAGLSHQGLGGRRRVAA